MDEEQRNGLSIESADGTVDDFGDARQSRKVEILEVEDEDARVRRFRELQPSLCSFSELIICIESIFEKLNSSSPSSHVPTRHGPGMPSFQFDFGERKTWAVEPPSERMPISLSLRSFSDDLSMWHDQFSLAFRPSCHKWKSQMRF